MFVDYPALTFLILFIIIPPVIGLAIAETFRDWLAYLCMAVLDIGGLYATTIIFAWMFRKYENKDERDARQASPAPRPALQNMNLQYNQNVVSVRFDARKNFANIVLARLEHGYAKVDLTEKYWLVRKPQKWQGTPDEFRAMMNEWNGDVFQRKNDNKNSAYIIRSEIRLRDKAAGRN